MLEPIFQNLINTILKVQNSHKESADKEAMLSRNWEFIFSDFDDWLIIYCITLRQAGGFWLYPMLCPQNKIEALKESLPNFNFHQTSAAYHHISRGDKHLIEPCWGDFKDFKKSEIPLFFSRQYYGHPKGKENYIEFYQLITHPLDLHWSPRKNSYCTIDDLGEEVEKIKIICDDKINLILIRRKTLDKLLYLGEWVLVRYFDFDRYNTDYYFSDPSVYEQYEPSNYEAKFEIRICDDKYVAFRGAQIERPKTPKEKLLSWRFGDDEDEDDKKYIECTVYDWKNKRILKNYSLDPRNFANYFTESDLPFEVSPIFFKAEVLDKYKNNPDKYDLTEWSISCRGGWILKTYGINEYNQVHTYAIYLARLPYTEQLHWLQYNEDSKGGISKRAFQTDFKGEFPDEKSKLEQLKESLEKLERLKVGKEEHIIWSPKGGSWDAASKGLYYVNSENPNQWHDFIIALSNTINEGFQIKPLRKIASSFGTYATYLGTLGLIKFILESSNNEEQIPIIHGVLDELQERRGKGKAHGIWDTPEGSLVEDANKRLDNVILAIEKLIEVLASLKTPI